MKRAFLYILVSSAVIAASLLAAKSSKPLPPGAKPGYGETVFDFGHVGIDYTIYHRYPFVNRTPDTLRILNVLAHCDCSSAHAADTVLAPGDSTSINLRFNTKNFYGPQNKTISVTTDHPSMQTVEYFYLSIIGQWFDGIKPEPASAFFLPATKPVRIRIPNAGAGPTEIDKIDQLDNYFTVKILSPRAGKGEALEVEVAPSPNVGRGTYHSNFTMAVANGTDEPTILTIPVKIVRY